MEKTEFIAKFVDGVFVNEYFTEYQAEVFFGSKDLNYHEADGYIAARVYKTGTHPTVEHCPELPNLSKVSVYSEPVLDTESRRAVSTLNILDRTDNDPYDEEAMWRIIRNVRNKYLVNSDTESKIIYPDIWDNLTDAKKTAWLNYRTLLRDIPQTYSKPHLIVWPSKPE
jgi:hypothetical protein